MSPCQEQASFPMKFEKHSTSKSHSIRGHCTARHSPARSPGLPPCSHGLPWGWRP